MAHAWGNSLAGTLWFGVASVLDVGVHWWGPACSVIGFWRFDEGLKVWLQDAVVHLCSTFCNQGHPVFDRTQWFRAVDLLCGYKSLDLVLMV